ncbi:hypothetical protein Q0M97_14370, partial [Staphylococcus aureus]|nr:hypothetical protein [Staphylococcus aureus]
HNTLKAFHITTVKKRSAFFLLGLFFFIITDISSFTMHIPTYLDSLIIVNFNISINYGTI